MLNAYIEKDIDLEPIVGFTAIIIKIYVKYMINTETNKFQGFD